MPCVCSGSIPLYKMGRRFRNGITEPGRLNLLDSQSNALSTLVAKVRNVSNFSSLLNTILSLMTNSRQCSVRGILQILLTKFVIIYLTTNETFMQSQNMKMVSLSILPPTLDEAWLSNPERANGRRIFVINAFDTKKESTCNHAIHLFFPSLEIIILCLI